MIFTRDLTTNRASRQEKTTDTNAEAETGADVKGAERKREGSAGRGDGSFASDQIAGADVWETGQLLERKALVMVV